MKKLGVAFLGLIFLLAVSVTLNAASPIAKVTLIKGKVSAVTGSKSRVLSKGASLFSGDKVVTAADGKIELRFSDSSIMRLASNSSINVSKGTDSSGRGQVNTSLNKGKNWVVAAKPSDSWGGLKSKTPLAVASIKGTVYRQSVAIDTTTKISVYEGAVEVGGVPKPTTDADGKPYYIGEPEEITMDQWLEVVKSLQQITITPDGKHSTESIPEDDAKDEWVVWNKELDSNELKKEP